MVINPLKLFGVSSRIPFDKLRLKWPGPVQYEKGHRPLPIPPFIYKVASPTGFESRCIGA
jgi:hypothetical protein